MCAIGSMTNHRGLIAVTATAEQVSSTTPTANAGKEVEDECVQDNYILHSCGNSGYTILSVLAIGINRRHRKRWLHRGSALATININGG